MLNIIYYANGLCKAVFRLEQTKFAFYSHMFLPPIDLQGKMQYNKVQVQGT